MNDKNNYTNKDLVLDKHPKKLNSYTPIPCVVIRRCKLCDAIMYTKHKDWGYAKNLRHENYEHECDMSGAKSMNFETELSHCIGVAEFVGYGFMKRTEYSGEETPLGV